MSHVAVSLCSVHDIVYVTVHVTVHVTVTLQYCAKVHVTEQRINNDGFTLPIAHNLNFNNALKYYTACIFHLT